MMMTVAIVQSLLLFSLMYGAKAAPAQFKEEGGTSLSKRGVCTPDVAYWAWQSAPRDPSASASTAIQDIVDIEAAQIRISPPAKAFALMLAHLSPGYMSGDSVMDATFIHKWDDCTFQDHVSFAVDLFALDNNVCGIIVNASKAEFTGMQGNTASLTLAPIIYEHLYLDLREDLPDLWCRGDEATCVADDTRTLFNHVIPLQLTKSKISNLSEDKVREILKDSAASPVFLNEGNSVAIIENFGGKDEWRGFYIDDPKAPKIWTLAQLQDTTKEFSVTYSDIHSALPPMPEPQEGCTWLRDGMQENALEIPAPTSRAGEKEGVKPSATALVGAEPSLNPQLKALKGGPASSDAGGSPARPSGDAAESTHLAPFHTASSGSFASSYANSGQNVPNPSHLETSEVVPTGRPNPKDAAGKGSPSLLHSDNILPSFTLASGAPHPSASDHHVVLPRKW
ncbi:hypothetical protein QFC22_006225 [Naganishia vaughanmartiniae]|uniref:Uncharacterized protein n=1 Tax=Naganishia vaughanmartiniae TaxID=1424756 RepID=A0ACC2WMN2_9TREE|nr:hypothetical protein QFC22_006225 [Naganishia vaughanmartiniae]